MDRPSKDRQYAWFRRLDGRLASDAWPGVAFDKPQQVREFLAQKDKELSGPEAFGKFITGKYNRVYAPRIID